MEVLWWLVGVIRWLLSLSGEQWLLAWCLGTLGYCLYVLILRPLYGWLHHWTFF